MPLESLDIMIGGMPVRRLRPSGCSPPGSPQLLYVDIAPGRGMLLLQARLRLASGEETDLFASPPLEEIPGRLDGGPDDFAGSASFSLGGAVLYPFANRILGPWGPDRTILAKVLGQQVSLPRNWGGKALGARQYAMHGLILDKAFGRLTQRENGGVAVLRGEYDAGDFAGQWLSSSSIAIEIAIAPDALSLTVQARNVGAEAMPVGIGWHPYFALPSGQREQACVHIPAGSRLEVDNYDEVVPTGRILAVGKTPYDLSAHGGAPLGEAYFDDCFVDLERGADGTLVCTIEDPAAGHGLRISTASPQVKAVQLYAPPEKAHAALEPQFNWPDPFGEEWAAEQDTGMAVLAPGEQTTYHVRVEPYAA